MSFGIYRFFSNSESGNLSTVQNPRLIVRSASAATPLAVVNVAQGLIAADTRTGTRKRKSDKCNPRLMSSLNVPDMLLMLVVLLVHLKSSEKNITVTVLVDQP